MGLLFRASALSRLLSYDPKNLNVLPPLFKVRPLNFLQFHDGIAVRLDQRTIAIHQPAPLRALHKEKKYRAGLPLCQIDYCRTVSAFSLRIPLDFYTPFGTLLNENSPWKVQEPTSETPTIFVGGERRELEAGSKGDALAENSRPVAALRVEDAELGVAVLEESGQTG